MIGGNVVIRAQALKKADGLRNGMSSGLITVSKTVMSCICIQAITV